MTFTPNLWARTVGLTNFSVHSSTIVRRSSSLKSLASLLVVSVVGGRGGGGVGAAGPKGGVGAVGSPRSRTRLFLLSLATCNGINVISYVYKVKALFSICVF